jgi:hypothetical protein
VSSVAAAAGSGLSESSKDCGGPYVESAKTMGVPSEGSESVPATADHGESIGRVGRALAGRYVEIGQEIAARIVDEIPGYRDLPPDVIADLRAGATATVELLA